MRHFKRLKKLGLPKKHRDALLKSLASDLVTHGRLRTTESRAKALAAFFGRLMRFVQKKEKREMIRFLPRYCPAGRLGPAFGKLIENLRIKYEKRTSGFTRITRVGMRKGDNAILVQIELV